MTCCLCWRASVYLLTNVRYSLINVRLSATKLGLTSVQQYANYIASEHFPKEEEQMTCYDTFDSFSIENYLHLHHSPQSMCVLLCVWLSSVPVSYSLTAYNRQNCKIFATSTCFWILNVKAVVDKFGRLFRSTNISQVFIILLPSSLVCCWFVSLPTFTNIISCKHKIHGRREGVGLPTHQLMEGLFSLLDWTVTKALM
jgi:hypothetical protein